jgi:predicted SnoaL-like aldol condensation-catalyzing enzyme
MHETVTVLKSLETGDPSAVTSFVNAERYIQHNLAFPDGRQVLLDALPHLAAAGTRVDTVRGFVDGDHVVFHSEYRLFGKHQVGFDVFRLQGHEIVEHWDNLQEVAPPNPSGRTMIDGEIEVRDRDRAEANKALVRAFVTEVLIGHRFEKLPEYISSATYLQHNPKVADGLDGLRQAGAVLAAYHYRRIAKLLGEGNFVLAISELDHDGRDAVVYDLFRVEGGKIVEHWDVTQPIPEKPANNNTMF